MKLRMGGWLLLAGVTSLTGCDQMNQAMGKPTLAESRAIGASCRQVGRPLEMCYKGASKANKAEMYAGWKEMDAYMRENNIPTMELPVAEEKSHKEKPGKPEEEAHAASAPASAAAASEPKAEKDASKDADKVDAKAKPAK